MGKKSRRNRPNGLPPGAKSLGTLTQEQVDSVRGLQKLRITPEKSEEFIKILERHPEHKTGDMSAVMREWQEFNGDTILQKANIAKTRHHDHAAIEAATQRD